MNKKLKAILLTLGIFVMIFLCTTTAFATCTSVTSGTNVDAQDYSTRSSPIYSYLVPLSSGKFMRVQGSDTDGKVYVEYYDSSYNITSKKDIAAELPIFGGFYATDSYYFILSGQTNTEESDSTEVYRITKYDKNWKRISSCGLYGANTTVPFDAGSARFAVCGNYLIIRTCHEMYTSSDGLNHQANVTIEVNMNTMTVTDSYYKVMNSSVGYVSHSFNQFIKVDNNKVVAVDHGDAYPRSICLIKYATDCSTGKFLTRYGECSCSDLLEIPGNCGDNFTGVSVGGFEISDTSYIVAGNVGNSEYTGGKFSGTRNIFVAASNKSTGSVTYKKITSYADGTESCSTPQLVALGDNTFMLLWSRNGNVYYCKLNDKGEKTTAVYDLAGELSDCVPIVSNGKVIWYTYTSSSITFTWISTTKLSSNNKITKNIGHKWAVSSKSGNTATMKCTSCGKTQSGTIPTSSDLHIWIYDFTTDIYTDSDGRTYTHYSYTAFSDCSLNTSQYENEEIDFGVGLDCDFDGIKVTLSNSTVAKLGTINNVFGTFYSITFLSPGTVTLKIASEIDPSINYSYTFTVSHNYGSAKVTKAQIGKAGKSVKTCANCSKTVTTTIPAINTVSLSKSTVAYTGNSLTPSVVVKDTAGKTLTKGTDYTVTYKNSAGSTVSTIKSIGTYSVIVTFKGNYTGSKTLTYKVVLGTPVPKVSEIKGVSGLKVTWSKSTGATGYIIYRKAGSATTWSQIKKITSGSTLSYTDTSVTMGTKYTYTVKAYMGSTYSSYNTTGVSLTFKSYPAVIVKNLSTSVSVNWTKIKGADGYIIYRKAGSATSWSQIKKITSGTTVSYTDKNVKTGITYTYTVKAYKGSSILSSYDKTGVSTLFKGKPTVSVAKVSSGVKVSWTQLNAADGYVVYRKTAGSSWKAIKTLPGGSVLSYVDTTAKKGTTYYYSVKAYRGSAMSDRNETGVAIKF